MKKTMSRLVALALVLVMVCGMIPAAFATVDSVTVSPSTTSLTIGGADATLTATVTRSSDDTTSLETVTWNAYTSADGTTASDVVQLTTGSDGKSATVKAKKAGKAYVVATSVVDSTKKSTAVEITVTAATLQFTTNPVTPSSYALNAVATALSVETSGGYGTTTYQWYSAADSSSTGTPISGQTGKTYTPATTVSGTTYYYCVATSTDGTTPMTATSTRAAITVTTTAAPLAFTTQPTGATYVKGETAASLSVATSGGYGTTTYQWYSAADSTSAGTAITGQTGKTYTPSTATVGNTWYYCKATSVDTLTSQTTMTVDSNHVKIEVQEPAYKVSLTATSTLLKNNASTTITATVKTAAGQAYTSGTETVTFTKSNSYITLSTTSKALSNGSASTTATAVSNGTTTVTAKVTIDGHEYTSDSVVITVKNVEADTIYYDSDSDGYAYFDEDDFYDEVKEASGSSSLDYVKFTTQYGGKLYKDDDDFSTSNKVTSSTKCYYEATSSQVDLDALCFVVDDDYKAHYVEYEAYTSGGTLLATGKVAIDDDGEEGDITYYASAKETVALDEDDFEDFFTDEYTNGSLDYVKFSISGASYYGTSSYGYLYESSASSADKVTSGTKYYFEASSSQDDLDDVVFTAGTKTTAYTVTIPFTAYGENKNGKTVNVEGELVIEVNDRKSVTISSKGETFKDLDLDEDLEPNVSASKLDDYYVKFDKVTGGTLYCYYTSKTNNELWSKRDKFYFSPGKNDYDISDVFFLPDSKSKTAEISYTLYKDSTEVDSGKIVFTVKTVTTVTFNDIPTNVSSWAGEAIEYMAEQGYISGTGTNKFSPNANMSRAMLVTVLYRMAGEPSVSGISNPFNDVASSQYYYKAVLWAYNKGIVTGKGAGKFDPNGNVSREEIATFLYRYAGKPTASSSLTGFSDYKTVSTYATDAMKWATKNSVITGIGGKLSPKSSASRAQVATMLYRYLEG